jgi:hypothetical protein
VGRFTLLSAPHSLTDAMVVDDSKASPNKRFAKTKLALSWISSTLSGRRSDSSTKYISPSGSQAKVAPLPPVPPPQRAPLVADARYLALAHMLQLLIASEAAAAAKQPSEVAHKPSKGHGGKHKGKEKDKEKGSALGGSTGSGRKTLPPLAAAAGSPSTAKAGAKSGRGSGREEGSVDDDGGGADGAPSAAGTAGGSSGTGSSAFTLDLLVGVVRLSVLTERMAGSGDDRPGADGTGGGKGEGGGKGGGKASASAVKMAKQQVRG